MSPSLAVMVLTLVASASPWQAVLEQKPPTNPERAKRGLLPRRSHPSRVTYLEGAARVRGDVREFPVAPTAPAAGPTTEPAVTEPAVTAAAPDAKEGRGEPVRVASAEPQETEALPPIDPAPAPARRTARAEPSEAPAGAARRAGDAGPGGEGWTRGAAPAPSSAVEEGADRARDLQAASEAMVVERAIDRAGRIVERRFGRDLRVLSTRVVGSIDELPVLASARTGSGEIVERVDDGAGGLEVRRDPVGRFVSARPLPAPEEE